MKVWGVLVLALVLVGVSTFSVEKVEAGRSDALMKFLNEMSKRMDDLMANQLKQLKALSNAHAKDRKESDRELARLAREYKEEQRKNNILKDENQQEQEAGAAALLKLRETYEKEMRLIQKIKNMLRHEIGTNKEHPAKSCAEVFLDATAPSGTYWIVENGSVSKKRCVRAGSNRTQWSGGCSQSNRGKSGWANMCLDTTEHDSAQDYLALDSRNSLLRVKKAGLYSITALVQTHCSGRCGRNIRILINGNSVYYNHWSHGYKTVSLRAHTTWPLNKGDRIQINVHGSGSDIWRWKSMNGGEARNRVQVAYLGQTSDEVFFSAGCSGHRRSSGWQRLCFNKVEHNPSVTKQHLDYYSDGRVIVKKSGYYHITASVMLHTNAGYHYLRVVVNGQNRQYGYAYNNGWQQVDIDLTYPLKADDTVEIYTHASGGNPYTWHSHATGGHTARIQLHRVSDLSGDQRVQMVQGGPSSHHRNANWVQYRLQRVQVNTLDTSRLKYESNGNIRVKKDGWIRVNAVGQLHTSGNQPHLGKITVNDKVISTTVVEHESRWQNLHHDVAFPVTKGDLVRVHWRAQGGNPYVHAFSSPSAEGMLEVFAY